MVFTHNPSTWTRYNSNYGSVNWMGWEVSGTGWSVAWQQRICYQFQLKALLIMLMTSTNSTLKWALALCHVICVKYYINKCRLCWRYFIMLNNLLFWFVYGVNWLHFATTRNNTSQHCLARVAHHSLWLSCVPLIRPHCSKLFSLTSSSIQNMISYGFPICNVCLCYARSVKVFFYCGSPLYYFSFGLM